MPQTTVAIIGGGPAGVASAIWLHQFGVQTVLLEAASELGGLQRQSPYSNDWIAGIIGKTGQEVAAALHKHALAARCAVRLNCAVKNVEAHGESLTLLLNDADKLHSRFVVVATGTIPRSGGFTESECTGIGPGLSMEHIAVKGKRVAILGGGDNAFDQALFAQQRGAREVKIFARLPPRAQRLLQARMPSGSVQVGPFTADQKAMTVGQEKFDVIGVQFGFEAAIPPGLSLQRADGYIAVDRLGKTSLLQVYACGDVTHYWHPCVTTACAHGIQVAKAIASTLSSSEEKF